jgi:hypothetical protein
MKGADHMVRGYLHGMRGVLTSALGITILLGTPLLAQADQGKWWTPKQGDPRVERRDRGARDQGSRDQGPRGTWRGGPGDRGGWRGGPGDRGAGRGGPADRGGWQGQGTWQRQRGGLNVRDRIVRDRVGQRDPGFAGSVFYRNHGGFSGRASWGGGFSRGGFSGWGGVPVRRDILVIRDRRYGGGFFRARRTYCAPRFYGRFVYVRPVRFFIGADAFVGPIGIHARIVRPHYLYGCNFCDATFDSYGAYVQHVEHCDQRPSGCGVSVSNWDDGGQGWDGPYQTDEGYRDGGRQDDEGSYDNQGSYDDQGSYGDDQGDQNDDGGYDDETH